MNVEALLEGLTPASGGFWFPPQYSTVAAESDWLYWFIFYVSLVFFIGIVGVMGYFVWKYKRKPGVDSEITATHHTLLEITWSVIPLLIVIFIFYKGWIDFLNMRTPPADSSEILVEAKQWNWAFTYPTIGAQSSDGKLHVPVGVNVKLTMSAVDVLHSLFIPHFRVKQDVVPGRYTRLWFNALKPDEPAMTDGPNKGCWEFPIICTEYCGGVSQINGQQKFASSKASTGDSFGHSDMHTKVVVHPSIEDYNNWLEREAKIAGGDPSVDKGKDLYQKNCATCHSMDATIRVGPGFGNFFGRVHEIEGGESIPIEKLEDYVKESLATPQAKYVKGFKEKPPMPAFPTLKSTQVQSIVLFLKSLK